MPKHEREDPRMKRNQLGRTGIDVSALCLGTMTFGSQTPQSDAFGQMDMALDAGVDFWDTAEMYPVPPKASYQGDSERIIGNWFEKSGRRKEVILATKHSGAGMKIARNGEPISSKTIPGAIEGSLKRLKTDYIDLYQFHWPNRGSYAFRQNWTYDASSQDSAEILDHMQDALDALQKEVDRGTIRSFGLSNDTVWGTANWLRLAEQGGLPRVASLQNEYSLMCRLFDLDMAELCHHEDVGLLAYSPLATGLLTGKYRDGAVPEGSRKSIDGRLGGRTTSRADEAVELYMAVAKKHGLDPVHMSLAWCMQRPFMASVIFGATTVDQLKIVLDGKDLVLSDDVMADLDEAHKACPMPF